MSQEAKNLIDHVLPGVREGWPYDDTKRIYHDHSHIYEMVLFIKAHGGWSPEVAAAVFHDWVYDPTAPKGQNESQSAEVARNWMTNDEWSDVSIRRVERTIYATVTHDPSPSDGVQLVLEADLERFTLPNQPLYDDLVRAEYSHVTDEQWNAGRRAVLEHYRDVCSQFRIGPDAAARAKQAVANIDAAIERLPGFLLEER